MKGHILLLLATTLLLACGKQDHEHAPASPGAEPVAEAKTDLIVAVGKVEPETEIVNLSSHTGGVVKAVFKRDGDQVSPGELLVQLDDDLEQRKIQEIKVQIRSQRTQVEIERAQLREAEIKLAHKKALLAKTGRLVERGAETRQAYDDLSAEIEMLDIGLERQRATIQLALSRIDELTAQLKTAETECQKRQFNAPGAGILLDMQVSTGESVSAFSTYAEFAPQGNLMIRAEVDELFSDRVQTGQKVEIVRTGNDAVIAEGQVVLVSPYLRKKSLFSEKANDQEDRRVREIRIALRDAGDLIINSKVECKIRL